MTTEQPGDTSPDDELLRQARAVQDVFRGVIDEHPEEYETFTRLVDALTHAADMTLVTRGVVMNDQGRDGFRTGLLASLVLGFASALERALSGNQNQ
jgi:hypothetical protein